MSQNVIQSNPSAGISEKRFVCSKTDCDAVFSKKRKLINHIRKHNGEVS